MEIILLVFVIIVLLLNLGAVVELLKSVNSKATSKSLFIAAAFLFSLYGIVSGFVGEKSSAATSAFDEIGLGMQNFFLSMYLFGGLVSLVWALIRKGIEMKRAKKIK